MLSKIARILDLILNQVYIIYIEGHPLSMCLFSSIFKELYVNMFQLLSHLDSKRGYKIRKINVGIDMITDIITNEPYMVRRDTSMYDIKVLMSGKGVIYATDGYIVLRQSSYSYMSFTFNEKAGYVVYRNTIPDHNSRMPDRKAEEFIIYPDITTMLKLSTLAIMIGVKSRVNVNGSQS